MHPSPSLGSVNARFDVDTTEGASLQWKQAVNWKALNPLAPKVVAQSGSEPRIETQSTSVFRARTSSG